VEKIIKVAGLIILILSLISSIVIAVAASFTGMDVRGISILFIIGAAGAAMYYN